MWWACLPSRRRVISMLLDGNDVIIVIRNDLVYQSVEVYGMSNKFQFTASLI